MGWRTERQANLVPLHDSVPTYPPPEIIQVLQFGSQEVALVVDEATVIAQLNRLAHEINPFLYDLIFYNRKGGSFLATQLERRWQAAHGDTLPSIIPIEYRSVTGENARSEEISKVTPLSFYPETHIKALLLEDMEDTGWTIWNINQDASLRRISLDVAVLFNKLVPKGRVNRNIRHVGWNIPPVWVMGCGSNSSRPELDRVFNRDLPLLAMPLDSAAQYYKSLYAQPQNFPPHP